MILILLITLIGCKNTSEEDSEVLGEVSDNFAEILDQKNPGLCLDYEDETVDGNFAQGYVRNIGEVEDDILFKDLCLIHSLSSGIFDAGMFLLCNEASGRIY